MNVSELSDSDKFILSVWVAALLQTGLNIWCQNLIWKVFRRARYVVACHNIWRIVQTLEIVAWIRLIAQPWFIFTVPLLRFSNELKSNWTESKTKPPLVRQYLNLRWKDPHRPMRLQRRRDLQWSWSAGVGGVSVSSHSERVRGQVEGFSVRGAGEGWRRWTMGEETEDWRPLQEEESLQPTETHWPCSCCGGRGQLPQQQKAS